MIFKDIIEFMYTIYNSLVDFGEDVMTFMSFEVLGVPLVQIFFGGAIGIYLAFVIGKFVIK